MGNPPPQIDGSSVDVHINMDQGPGQVGFWGVGGAWGVPGGVEGLRVTPPAPL